MKINQQIFDEVKNAGSRIVVVTKYFSPEKTQKILAEISKKNCVWAIGENRIDNIIAKKISEFTLLGGRGKCHFIGNIQSRNIQKITENCAVIHSLCEISHAEKFANFLKNNPEWKTHFFIEINISREKSKQGVLPENLASFLEKIKNLNLDIIGISSLGRGEFTLQQKEEEFEELKKLRNKFLPKGIISAGTSCDYHIALKHKIEVVRIGTACFK